MVPTSYCPRCLHAFLGAPQECPNLGCRILMPGSGWGKVLTPGDLLDRTYLVLELLAIGGAGMTYRCQEVDASGRPHAPDLAIKVLHTRRDSGQFLRRLATEAQILQELDHIAIVECRGFVQRAGHAPYLVTRFEAGGTLTSWFAEVGILPPRTVAGILRQMFDALDIAHARGVVHRDLKPDNVLLRQRTDNATIPEIRIADFGIAKLDSGLGSGLTRVGAFIGTPQYAAPEQFLGRPSTAATDVFSAGAIAFFLSTGRPYVRLSSDGSLEEHYHQVMAALPPEGPQLLARSRRGSRLLELIRGTMQPDPEARWTVSRAARWLDETIEERVAPSPARLPPGSVANTADTAPPAPLAPTRPVVHGRLPVRADKPRQADDDGTRTEIRTRRVRAPSEPAIPPNAATLLLGRARPAPRQVSEAEPPTPAHSGPSLRSELADRQRPGAARTEVRPATADPRKEQRPLRLDDLVPEERQQATVESESARPAAPLVAGPVEVARAGEPVWLPASPSAVPDPPPTDPQTLLRHLGAANTSDRRLLSASLLQVDPRRLEQSLRSYKLGDDPLIGRGVALFMEIVGRRDWEPLARTLLADPDTGVRVAACVALARVGQVPALKTLSELLRDPATLVRVAAVRSVTLLALAQGRAPMGVFLVRPLSQDIEGPVREAARRALVDLE